MDRKKSTNLKNDLDLRGHIIVNQLVNASDHSSVNDVTMQVFVGDYENLRDAYIHPLPVFERVDVRQFSGRQWLKKEIDDFIEEYDHGLFAIEADAGVGKTAFLAHLVKSRGYISHFVELAPGIDGLRDGLRNLAAQLIRTWKLDPYLSEGVLPKAATRPHFLQNIIFEAAKARNETSPKEKIIIVVDALDEAGTPYGQNVLGLPKILPEGVFLVVAYRPVQISLMIEGPQKILRLHATDDRNLNDMDGYLRNVVRTPEIAKAILQNGFTENNFIKTVISKCNGLWIYVKYLVQEIKNHNEIVLDLENLPKDLSHFYARYWLQWREKDEARWDEAYLPLLSGLATIQEACTLETLIDWMGIPKKHSSHLRRILKEHWRAFVTVSRFADGDDYFYFNHATLRDFFCGRHKDQSLPHQEFLNELTEQTQVAHKSITLRILDNWGGLESNLSKINDVDFALSANIYGMRHIVTHLVNSGQIEKVHVLLGLEHKGNEQWENIWFALKQKLGELDSYLSDVTHARNISKESGSLSLQLKYALFNTSINSLGANYPIELLIALSNQGVWHPTQCIAYARRIPDIAERASALLSLSGYIPKEHGEAAAQEALETAYEIVNEGTIKNISTPIDVAQALFHSGTFLQEKLRSQQEALHQSVVGTLMMDERNYGDNRYEKAQSIIQKHDQQAKHASARIKLGIEIYGYWGDKNRERNSLSPSTLSAIRDMDSESKKVALASVVEILPLSSLDEATIIADTLPNRADKALILSKIANRLPKEKQEKISIAAIDHVYSITEQDERIRGLVILTSLLPEKFLGKIKQEAIDGVSNHLDGEDFALEMVPLLKALNSTELGQLLNVAEEKLTPNQYATILVIASNSSESRDHDELLSQALAIAKSLYDNPSQIDILLSICEANYVSKKIIDKVSSYAYQLDRSNLRIRVLSKVAEKLPQDEGKALLQELLREIQCIDDKSESILAQTKFVSLIQSGDRAELVTALFKEAIGVRSSYSNPRIFTNLAIMTAEDGNFPVAFEIIEYINNPFTKAQTLLQIADYLMKDELDRVLIPVKEITTTLSRDKQNTLLGETSKVYAKNGKFDNAILVCREISNEIERARILSELFSQAAKEIHPKILEEIRGLVSNIARAQALTEIAMLLSHEERETIIQEALLWSRRIQGEVIANTTGIFLGGISRMDARVFQVRILKRIANCLPDNEKLDVLQEALEISFAIESWDGSRFDAVASIIEDLPPMQASEALQIAVQKINQLSDWKAYSRSMANIFSLLPESEKSIIQNALLELLEEKSENIDQAHNSFFEKEWGQIVIDLISKFQFSDSSEDALQIIQLARKALSPQVRNSIVRELINRLIELDQIYLALVIIDGVPDDQYKADGLFRIARHSSEYFRYLPKIAQLEDIEARNQAFKLVVSPLMEEFPNSETLNNLVWDNILPIISSRSRKSLLADLQSLSPLIKTKSSVEIKELVYYIQDVERWWP